MGNGVECGRKGEGGVVNVCVCVVGGRAKASLVCKGVGSVCVGTIWECVCVCGKE